MNKTLIKLFYLLFILTNIYDNTLKANVVSLTTEQVFPYHEKYRLDNGLSVILSPNYNNPIIDISVYIDAGFLDDFKKKPKISRGVFYSLFKGGTNKFTKKQMDEKLIQIGNKKNRFDTYGMMYSHSFIQNTCLKEDSEDCVELISQILINPKFKGRNIISTFFYNLLNIPFRNNVNKWGNIYNMFIGYKSLSDVYYNKYELKKWYKEHIIPHNITISISGDFNTLHMKNIINKYFSNWISYASNTENNDYEINITENSGINIAFNEESIFNSSGNSFSGVKISIIKKTDEIGMFSPEKKIATRVFKRKKIPLIQKKIFGNSFITFNHDISKSMPHLYIEASNLDYSLMNTYYKSLIDAFKDYESNIITEEDIIFEKKELIKYIKDSSFNIRKTNDVFYEYIIRNSNNSSLDKDSLDIFTQIQSVHDVDAVNSAAKEIFDTDNFIMLINGNLDSCKTFLEQFDNVKYYYK